MMCMQLVCFHKHTLYLSSLFSQKLPFKFNTCSSSWSYSCRVHAVKEKEDSESEQYDEYDIDTEKAREALQKLDQQLQSLSTKKISSPKLRASDVKLMRGEESVNIREKEVEISPSFLAYTAAGLVLFTIFYNFLFYTVIAPSIDGP